MYILFTNNSNKNGKNLNLLLFEKNKGIFQSAKELYKYFLKIFN